MTETERDALWEKVAEEFEIEVPEDLIQNEIAFFTAQAKHCLRYETLTGGRAHPFADLEIERQKADIRAAAILEAKKELILKKELKADPPVVTAGELQAEAEAVCGREHTTMELVRRFFGDDLRGLERDLQNRKIIDRLCSEYIRKENG